MRDRKGLDALTARADDLNASSVHFHSSARRVQREMEWQKYYLAEMTKVLKVKVDKLVDRGERLETLTARADDLNTSSVHFHGSARRVQRKMKWQNYKATIFIITIAVIVVGLIVLIAAKT